MWERRQEDSLTACCNTAREKFLLLTWATTRSTGDCVTIREWKSGKASTRATCSRKIFRTSLIWR